jgi:hypothetical protein
MGTEAPRWWRQLLEQLQVAAAEAMAAAADGSAGSKGWQPSNLQAICDTLENLFSLPHILPKAVWKKVLALQVLAGLLHMSSMSTAEARRHLSPCLSGLFATSRSIMGLP